MGYIVDIFPLPNALIITSHHKVQPFQKDIAINDWITEDIRRIRSKLLHNKKIDNHLYFYTLGFFDRVYQRQQRDNKKDPTMLSREISGETERRDLKEN